MKQELDTLLEKLEDHDFSRGRMSLESPELVTATIAIAQAIPLFVAVFLYLEGTAYIERVKLHDRIWVLENRLNEGHNKRV